MFNFDTLFSGNAPGEPSPWLRAEFNDATAAPGWDVRLTLTASNLVPGTENVDEWYFNLNPALNSMNLEFNPVDVSASDLLNGKGDNGIYKGINAEKADGDGYYDFKLNFPPPSAKDSGQFASRFTNGETVILDIRNSASPLNAESFNFRSLPGGSQDTFFGAAHIQNTPGGSAWVGASTAAPEPLSAVLGLIGAGTMILRRRLKDPSL